MKNAKNIQKITTSLFLAATLVLGSVSFAVPGIMPSAFAATENLYVSADNKLFDKSFNGPMVIEVVVNDNDIDEASDLTPDVTINGADLAMVQAGDGNWYAYFAEKSQVIAAENTNITFGDTIDGATLNGDDTVYVLTDDVVRQPKTIESGSVDGFVDSFDAGANWPIIQAFDFAVDGSVTITYAKGGNPQSIALTYLDDPDDYAGLTLDRDSYPPGADVHMTITSMSHNIDPTDEDSWTYNTENSTAYYQYFDENGQNGTRADRELSINTGSLNFDDSGLLTIITNPNGKEVLDFRTNNDQNVTSSLGENIVTILETQPNSGVFKNTDDADTANIVVLATAQRDLTGTIDYADSALSVPVRNYPGSLTMDVTAIGGTFNGGEEIPVTLDDGDLNLNSLKDQDIELDNWNIKIPTVTIGSPLTLDDATIWTLATRTIIENSTGVNVTTTVDVNLPFVAPNLDIDLFSKRALITPINSTDLSTVTQTVNATTSQITTTYTSYTIANASDVQITFIIDDFDTSKYFYYLNTNVGENTLTAITDADLDNSNSYTTTAAITDGSLILVSDIFRFGQSAEDIESAATTRSADAIYRMLLHRLV